MIVYCIDAWGEVLGGLHGPLANSTELTYKPHTIVATLRWCYGYICIMCTWVCYLSASSLLDCNHWSRVYWLRDPPRGAEAPNRTKRYSYNLHNWVTFVRALPTPHWRMLPLDPCTCEDTSFYILTAVSSDTLSVLFLTTTPHSQ